MRETTYRILQDYQVRKTKKQKSDFIDFVSHRARELGYDVRTEGGMLGSRNIVVGDPDKAKVVFTAHYDTAPVLPFPNFITPRSIIIYIVYQIAIVLGIYAMAFVVGFGFSFVGGVVASLLSIDDELLFPMVYLFTYLAILGALALMICGPANKHTANDNTSGVTTLLDIMSDLPIELQDSVAFVFFDLEEMGMFGSMGFAKKHRAEMKDKLVVNFDCVSDGKHILLALSKDAVKYSEPISVAFKSDGKYTVDIASKGVFYPSDQTSFKCGVGVAALKKGILGILYMDRIHTSRDTIYDEENIQFLVDCSLRLVNQMNSEI